MNDKQNYTILLICCFLLLAPFNSNARTWYVKVDGSGDAPTIQAGIDSAVAGDVVLVSPGTYAIADAIDMKSGIKLQSESGPILTIIKPSQIFIYAGIKCRSVTNSEVNGFWIKPFNGMGAPSLHLISSNTILISNNIIESPNWGLYIDSCEFIYVHNNLFMGEGGSNEGDAIYFYTGGYTELNNNIIMNNIECPLPVICIPSCNDIIGQPGCVHPSGYFSQDPQFCGEDGSNNYYLQSDSPCAPGNDPLGGSCGLIGPLPVGCGTVDVDTKSWGEIKTMYQE